MKSLALNVRNWWECTGDELWAMILGRSNIDAQGDQFLCCSGSQALEINSNDELKRVHMESYPSTAKTYLHYHNAYSHQT